MRMLAALFVFGLISLSSLVADEKLKGIACRSVHLQWRAPASEVFFNEVEVKESARGTYFSVCGWNQGYYGIQELGNGKKLLIFSVWDSHENDPNAVPEEQRVKLVRKHELTRIGRFGGEGSGGQSFLDFDWKNGEKYQFAVSSKRNGNRMEYSGLFFHPEKKSWIEMVCFSTITKDEKLHGYYSFVEDFRRNRESAKQPRIAKFGPAFTKSENGDWALIKKATFTADSNPVLNIDAGLQDESAFFLATGGEIENKKTKLGESMEVGDVAQPELLKSLDEFLSKPAE